MSSPADLDALRAFAAEVALQGAHVAARWFRRAVAVECKGKKAGFDPVTEADRAAEAAMRNAIAARFPDHRIIGEEAGETGGDSPWCWYLDPIDGTRAFIAGLPSWTTLVGLACQGRPVVGAIVQPILKEVFTGVDAGATGGAWLNGRPIAVSPRPALDEAVLMTTGPEYFSPAEWTAFRRLADRCRIVRYSFDAYAYAMLAAGHVDLVVESGLAAHDIMALVPILRGAGGVISGWEPDSAPGVDGGRVLAAADPALQAAAAGILTDGKTAEA